MLIWYAAARHESVAQTRRYYTNIVLGVEQPPKEWKEEWEVRPLESVGSPKGKSPKGKGKERERDKVPKKRFSAGGPCVTFGEGSGS
jgi:hypothetical protein